MSNAHLARYLFKECVHRTDILSLYITLLKQSKSCLFCCRKCFNLFGGSWLLKLQVAQLHGVPRLSTQSECNEQLVHQQIYKVRRNTILLCFHVSIPPLQIGCMGKQGQPVYQGTWFAVCSVPSSPGLLSLIQTPRSPPKRPDNHVTLLGQTYLGPYVLRSIQQTDSTPFVNVSRYRCAC